MRSRLAAALVLIGIITAIGPLAAPAAAKNEEVATSKTDEPLRRHTRKAPRPTFEWAMIDVSSGFAPGDAHLLRSLATRRAVMIDVGTYEAAKERVLWLLDAHKIRRLHAVVITHPHRDHYGGLRALVEDGIKIDTVYFHRPDRELCEAEEPWGCDYEEVDWYIDMLRRHDIDVAEPRAGASITFDRWSRLTALYAFDGRDTPVGTTDINDMSVITRLDIGSTSVLFTGDLNASLGGWLASQDLDLRPAVLLKAPHHGGEGMPGDAFFESVDPDKAFVPTERAHWCDDERTKRLREWLDRRDTPTFVNGLQGNVEVTFLRNGSHRVHLPNPARCTDR